MIFHKIVKFKNQALFFAFLLILLCVILTPAKVSEFKRVAITIYAQLGSAHKPTDTNFSQIVSRVRPFTPGQRPLIEKLFTIYYIDNTKMLLVGRKTNWICLFNLVLDEKYPYDINGICYENNSSKMVFDDRKPN